ncbi:MAG TPA: cytochrome c oxidase subunit II [Puia sp.]|nr:cytochrome c oxidase subunit II [Puia sp.]
MPQLFHIILLQSVENPASVQAVSINHLFNRFNIVAAAMLLLVVVLTVWFTVRFRRRPGDNAEGLPIEGNRRIEFLMIGVPVLLLVWFFYDAFTTARAVLPATEPGRRPDIVITGHQFWWEAHYPGRHVVTANEIHLPIGRQLLMEMRSADVIHDWWVPELGNKMDLIPGVKNYLWLTISKPGDYIGTCSEFCGEQHAWMRILVVAQSEEDFSRWLDSNARAASPPQDALGRDGEALFQAKSCANCHRVEGTMAAGTAGPDLTHLASRSTLLTGLLNTNEKNLVQWIGHPQDIKHGAYMPGFMFPEDTVAAIAHYLEQLK